MAALGRKTETEIMERPSKKATKGVPYDRGFAWVIVVASFMLMTVLSGIMKAGAIFFVEIQRKYESSSAATSLVFGSCNLVAMVTSLPARILVERYGTRNTIMMGAFLVGLSNVLSSVAPNFYFLYFSIGACAGLGMALMFSPTLVLVCSYFKQYRSVANALTVCGNAMGGLVMPPIANALIDHFELSGSFLLVGGLGLNAVVFAALMLPLDFWTPTRQRSKCTQAAKVIPTGNSCEQHARRQSHGGDDDDDEPPKTESTWHRSLLHASDWNVTSITPQHLELADRHTDANFKRLAELAWQSEADIRNNVVTENAQTSRTNRPYSSLNELSRSQPQTIPLALNCDGVSSSCAPVPSGLPTSTSKAAVVLFPNSSIASDAKCVSHPVTESELPKTVTQRNEGSAAPPAKPKFFQVAVGLLHNPLYVSLVICHAFFAESFKALMICIPAHLVSVGFNREEAVRFLTCLYLSDLAGRLASIAVSMAIQRRKPRFITKRLVYILYIHCYGLGVIAFAFSSNNSLFIFLSLAFLGAASGLGVANYAVVLTENCKIPIEQLGVAHSLAMLIQSIGIIFMSYALGALADAMHTWKWSLLLSGVLSQFGALVANSNLYLSFISRLCLHTSIKKLPADSILRDDFEVSSAPR